MAGIVNLCVHRITAYSQLEMITLALGLPSHCTHTDFQRMKGYVSLGSDTDECGVCQECCVMTSKDTQHSKTSVLHTHCLLTHVSASVCPQLTPTVHTA